MRGERYSPRDHSEWSGHIQFCLKMVVIVRFLHNHNGASGRNINRGLGARAGGDGLDRSWLICPAGATRAGCRAQMVKPAPAGRLLNHRVERFQSATTSSLVAILTRSAKDASPCSDVPSP